MRELRHEGDYERQHGGCYHRRQRGLLVLPAPGGSKRAGDHQTSSDDLAEASRADQGSHGVLGPESRLLPAVDDDKRAESKTAHHAPAIAAGHRTDQWSAAAAVARHDA